MKQIKKYMYFIFTLISMLMSGCGNTNSADNFDSNISEITYSIGYESISFKSLKQENYPITAELFYPSKSQGDESGILDAHFPLIIFAHGYQQRYSNYKFIWEALVPKGYILAFLTIQQGLSINIDAYADDIVSLENELRSSSQLGISGHLSDKSALMGHSTGGGAIYLAQQKLPQTTTLISLAALTQVYGPIFGTSPIDVSENIRIPTLILSGEQDCITPSLVHQKLFYDSIAKDKTMVTISGGDHCGFSDSSSCSVAEALSCALFFQGESISEENQRMLTLKLITPWLEHFLKNTSGAWSQFLYLNDSDVFIYEMVMD